MRYMWIVVWFAIVFSVKDARASGEAETEASRDKGSMAIERCKYHLNRKEYQEARSLLEAALCSQPANPDLLSLLGDSWVGLGDHEKALEAYTRSIQHNSRQASVFFARGVLYGELNDWAHAIADYSKGIQIDPSYSDSPRVYYSRGSALYEQRKYAKARLDLERAWEGGFKKPTAYSLAMLLATCPDPAVRDGHRAVKYAETACQQTRFKDPACLSILAAAHAEVGEWEAAIRRGKQACSLAEDGHRHFFELCLALYQLHEPYRDGYSLAPADRSSASSGDPLRAHHLKTEPHSKDTPNPELADIHYRLGKGFLYQNPVTAIGHYDRAIELDPKNPSGWAFRAEAYTYLGKAEEAMLDAKAALVLNSKHFNGRAAFVWCLASLGETKRASCELKALDEEFPNHASVHLIRGHCYIAQNRFDDAVVELTLALKEIPRCVLAYSERAVAFSALGKENQAKRDFEECVRLAPSLRVLLEAHMKSAKRKAEKNREKKRCTDESQGRNGVGTRR